MSVLTRLQVRDFLIKKPGYLKKGASVIAEALWKIHGRANKHKIQSDVEKDLKVIYETQRALRAAKLYKDDSSESLINVYNKIISKNKKRLFFDIEVSPDIVMSWGIGYKVNISHESIIKERAIICICYKWEGDNRVYHLSWNNGDDKLLVQKFAKIINSADEVITQNGDSFDIKWLRTRCLYHNVYLKSKFNTYDTKKMAQSGFYFNCNKLDYMSKFLGSSGKMKTDYDLWKNIIMYNDTNSMKRMIEYCKGDVNELEKVFNKLRQYTPVKIFRPLL